MVPGLSSKLKRQLLEFYMHVYVRASHGYTHILKSELLHVYGVLYNNVSLHICKASFISLSILKI